MSDVIRIIERYQKEQGWTDSTVLTLLTDYIYNQMSPESLEDFLAEAAAIDEVAPEKNAGPLSRGGRMRGTWTRITEEQKSGSWDFVAEMESGRPAVVAYCCYDKGWVLDYADGDSGAPKYLPDSFRPTHFLAP